MAELNTMRALAQVESLLNSDEVTPEVKTKLAEVKRDLPLPLQTDRWIYRAVVTILGFIAVSTVVGGIALELMSTTAAAKTLPQGIVSIGSAAIGALAGLLAPSPGN